LALGVLQKMNIRLSDWSGSGATDALHATIKELSNSNAKLQRWVIGLAIVSMISTAIQTVFTVLAYVKPPVTQQSEQSSSRQPQPSVQPLASPGQSANQSSGQPIKKSP
jgi:hypothetical protein